MNHYAEDNIQKESYQVVMLTKLVVICNAINSNYRRKNRHR